MNVSSIPAASRGGTADTKDKIRDSASQFEALLISQLMRSMRESSGGWLGAGEDQAGATMAEFAEQHLATVLSSNGGLGLAQMIQQGLSRSSTTDRK